MNLLIALAMATTKPTKRGFLERSRAVPAPAADTVTETRSELRRPDLSIAALNSSLTTTKVPVLPTDLETEHVLEDYTEAYFSERELHYEDEQLVSSKKPELGPGRDIHSNRFQSHVNPAFQHDSESRWGSQGSSSEAAEPFKTDRTKVSQKEQDKRSDANSKVHSKRRPDHAHIQSPKDIHKNQDQVKVLADSSGGTLAPKLDRAVIPSKNSNCKEGEVKSGESRDRELDVNITVVNDGNDEKIEVFVDPDTVADSNVVYPASSDNDDVPSPTDQRQCPDDVFVPAVTQKQSGGGGRTERPHARNVSSVTAHVSNDISESGSNRFQRSRSMRLPLASDSEIHRVRKPLLRELSFSDCDSKKVRNYGCLGASSGLPRRRHVALGLEDEDNRKHIPKFLKSELAASLLGLMQQLLARGKVRQVAVLEQGNCCLLASLPTWHLTHRDQIGLVKAATSSLETMFKISLEKEFYTCFKHGTDKIVCHSGDSVLVAQTTHSCVVVGVASDHIPGSCLYEVSELARALLDKGW